MTSLSQRYMGNIPKKGCGPVEGVKWTSFVMKFFVGAIKPMDQLINTVGLNFEKKYFYDPPLVPCNRNKINNSTKRNIEFLCSKILNFAQNCN